MRIEELSSSSVRTGAGTEVLVPEGQVVTMLGDAGLSGDTARDGSATMVMPDDPACTSAHTLKLMRKLVNG